MKGKPVLITLLVVFVLAFCGCIGALIYCGIMTSYTAYTDDNTYEAIPAAYKKPAEQQGKIVSITYQTSTYYGEETWPGNSETQPTFAQYADREDVALEKTIYLYLPYGYDAEESRAYNVLYHIHGTTCDGTTLIKGEGKESETKNLLDNMIQNGDMEPTIVVFPTWYNGLDVDEENPDYLINHFGTELIRDIMPAVESQFRTYAGLQEDMTEEEITAALEASRDHRAVSGYSRGGCLTWNIFANMMAYFRWYVPISGDYLCELQMASVENSDAKVEQLIDQLQAEGYGPEDFFVYSSVGALDFAYEGVHTQFLSMLRHPDFFIYGRNAEEGNFYLCTAPKLWHGDTMSPHYLYNALQVIFH